MTQEAKFIAGITVVTIGIIIGAAFFLGKEQQKEIPVVDNKILARNDNNTITSSTAKVSIVEFADFQCPACANTYPGVKQIIEEYKGKITYTYRHYPLPQHKNAILAAKAAEAAGKQGKFWEMENLLYTKQQEWGESSSSLDVFIEYAKVLGLNEEVFKADTEGNAFDARIQQDKRDAQYLGVNSTPTFFINNKKFTEVPSYANLKNAIEAALP